MGLFSNVFSKNKKEKNISIESTEVIEEIPAMQEETSSMETSLPKVERKVLSEIERNAMITYISQIKSGYNRGHYNSDSPDDIDMESLDPLFEDAARLIVIHQQGSTSLIQRSFSIGYNRAGRIMDQLEKRGIVGPTNGIKAQQVLCSDEENLKLLLSNINVLNNNFNPQFTIEKLGEAWLNDFKQKNYLEIEACTQDYIKKIQEEEKAQERELIEAEKERIRKELVEKRKNREIREAAMKELAEEGIIDADFMKKREPIPQNVQDIVWNRDGGRCVKCGTQENLEFDHIIPFSKGGSNSIRNLQLLCKKCNIEKSNRIG